MREEFGATEVQRSAETSSSAMAARAQAEIQARYVMATTRPRSTEVFRSKLLRECDRLGFADEAEYQRPVGKNPDGTQKFITGPSIRLIEAAIRFFGNVAAESPIIMEAEDFRLVRAVMTDLETNTVWSQDIVIPKRVERKGWKGKPPDGRIVISERLNSYQEKVFLVEATDDEVAIKQSAMNSKAQRKNGERLLPSDIIHEAVAMCRETVKAGINKDPDAAKRKLIDGFASVNINAQALEEYLGKKLDLVQPNEIAELRRIWKAITDGEITWEAAVAARDIQGSKEAQQKVAAERIAQLTKEAADTKTAAQQQKPAETQQQTSTTVDVPVEELDLRKEIAAWVQTIPNGIQILGKIGYENAGQIPEAKLADVLAELKAAAPGSQSKSTTTGKPVFGKKA